MFMDSPERLIYVVVGVCLLGWLLFRISARSGNRYKASQRDPRDDRIRSLEANERVAKIQVDKTQANLHGVGGDPPLPERWKRVRDERVAANSHVPFPYPSLNHVIQHRVDRQNGSRFFQFDETFDIGTDSSIKEVRLVGPDPVNRPRKQADPPGSMSEQEVVKAC